MRYANLNGCSCDLYRFIFRMICFVFKEFGARFLRATDLR